MQTVRSIDEKKTILRIALLAGEILIKNGAEIYRVEDTICRICESKGLKGINTYATPTFILLGDNKFDGFTFVKHIRKRGINIDKICKINDISRKFVNSDYNDYEETIQSLEAIDDDPGYPSFSKILAAAISSGVFTFLFKGGLSDFTCATLTSMIALLISEKIEDVSSVSFLGNGVAAFLITVISIVLMKLNLSEHFDLVIVGAIYPLLPGVSLTNSIRDFISGDLVSGVSKGFEAVMTAIAIATGVGSGLLMWMKFGGVL
ncbi:MAG: threonine/serine exporter family protein [Filifactor alocis]|nr:threonine/serine exporter family protein [Filifactor alocis]